MFNSLQACRAIAAIAIVAAHANLAIFSQAKYFGVEPFGRMLDIGHGCIDFFFVLSGFLILHAHSLDIGQPRELGRFYWIRYSRVFLFHWVVLAAVMPVYFLFPSLGVGHEREPGVLTSSLLLLPHPQNLYILSVAWTLPFEMLFYCLFGLLVVNRRIGIALFGLWGLGCLAHGWFDDSFPWSFVFNNYHLRTLAGMLACLLLQHGRLPAPRVVAALGAGLFLGTGLVFAYHGLSGWSYIIGFTVGSALIIAGCAEANRTGKLSAPRWLAYLGDATFSIYLTHLPVLSIIAKLCKWLRLDDVVPTMPLFGLHVIGAIAVGCLAYELVEKPLHHWSKRQFRREAPKETAPTVPEPEMRSAA